MPHPEAFPAILVMCSSEEATQAIPAVVKLFFLNVAHRPVDRTQFD